MKENRENIYKFRLPDLIIKLLKPTRRLPERLLVTEITDRGISVFNHLKEQGGLNDTTELLNNMIGMARWCIKEVFAGRKILSYNPEDNTYKELQMEFLDRVAKSGVDNRALIKRQIEEIPFEDS